MTEVWVIEFPSTQRSLWGAFFSFLSWKNVCVDLRDMVEQRCDCTEEGSSVLSLLVQAKTNISVQEPTHIQSVYINSLLSFCSFSVLSLTRTQSLFIQALTHTHTHRRYLYDLSHTYGARTFFLQLRQISVPFRIILGICMHLYQVDII